MLLGIPFLDELGSGLPVVGAPALQADLFASFAGLSLAVFTVPQLAALVLDPPALWFASRFRRSQAIAAGLWIYALALVVAATSHAPWLFALAWTVTSIATGVVCSAAQAELIDRSRDCEERAMAEWTLGSGLGDLAGPLLLAGVAATGRTGREGWFVAAAIFVAWGALARSDGGATSRDAPSDVKSLDQHEHEHASESGEVPLAWTTLWHRARQTPGLLAWLLAATLCSLMDETLVALCALWMKHHFASDSAVTLAVLALMTGGILGLIVLHRASERVAPRRFLVLSCVGAAVALLIVVWLSATSLPLVLAATFALGACAATHYPLAQAAAYRCLPSSSTTVAALAQFFGPVDLLIPLALGIAADRWGLGAALCGLLIQPVALVLATVASRRRAR